RLGDESYLDRWARRSFYLACEIINDEGIRLCALDHLRRYHSHDSWKVRLLRRRVSRPALFAAASLGLRSGPRHLGANNAVTRHVLKSPADVVLVSEQYTDSFHAIPLAHRLATKLGERFLWVGMRPRASDQMTSEEVDLLASVNFKQPRFLDSSSSDFWPRVNRLTSFVEDAGSSWQVAGLLARQAELRLTRARWFELLMDSDLRGFASRYATWDRRLTELQPKVLVGLSTLQDMALIRAWARRNEVPFVGFMHGVFPWVDSAYHVDADYLGVFGTVSAEEVTQSSLPQPRRVTACGA